MDKAQLMDEREKIHNTLTGLRCSVDFDTNEVKRQEYKRLFDKMLELDRQIAAINYGYGVAS